MTYDPKNRPVFLGTEQNRTNPNRLSQGVLSVADQNENQIVPIPQPPSTIQKILHGGKIGALILVTLAAGALALESQGIVLPASLHAIALAIVGVGAALGITSKGLDKPEGKAPDDLK